MAGFQYRMLRAAKLDVHLYEEVEADKSAMRSGHGCCCAFQCSSRYRKHRHGSGRARRHPDGDNRIPWGWYIWAYLTYFIGTKFLPEPQTHADLGELLRTIGFSSSPGLIRVLGIIPGLGAVVFSAASIWMLVAMVIAVRQALDYKSTWRAVGVCAIGWVIQTLILMLLFSFMAAVSAPPAG